MANQAWLAGWDRGAGRKRQDDDSDGDDVTGKRKKKTTGTSSGTGGRMSWSILPIVGKALGFGGSKKKGGPIHKTALYLLHSGEHVLPASAKRGKSHKVVIKRSVLKR